jgi:hypothetical protein
MQRDFKVSSKGLKGKHQTTPFVELRSLEGEKVTLHLESKQQLDDFQIDQEFTVKIGKGEQTNLVHSGK